MTAPEHGEVQELAPGLRAILAPNPSPMTYWGTNTFLIGESDVAVVDPGPADAAHLDQIKRAAGDRISKILITHPHLDHSPGAKRLSEETGAPVFGFGTAAESIPDKLRAFANLGGGEGVDHTFLPDIRLSDGDSVTGDDWSIQVIETPGHFAGHLAFATDTWILSGDHAMAWASTLISPPHGDLGDFRRTTDRLLLMPDHRFFPSHGPELADPSERLMWLLAHRQSREDQIREVLSDNPLSIHEIALAVYTDIDPRMMPAAERNLLAHLIDLVERSEARSDSLLHLNSRFTRA